MGSTRGVDTETVAWRALDAGELELPIAVSLPSLELQLEHPGLEATGRLERFFPDAVPYALEGTARVFYWRDAFERATAAAPNAWQLACATTFALTGATGVPAEPPSLLRPVGDGRTRIVVDGTIAGDATTADVAHYDPPSITIDACSPERARVVADGETVAVDVGSREQLPLRPRRVRPCASADGSEVGPSEVTPRLAVRYPGVRELHHPAPGADYRLFPSFGLCLEDLPDQLRVPTTGGELDDWQLADQLGVSLTERPYPERVLWQAFAFTAFDPHGDGESAVGQFADGRLVVVPPSDQAASAAESSSS